MKFFTTIFSMFMEKLKGNNKIMVFCLIILALGFITGIVLGIYHFF